MTPYQFAERFRGEVRELPGTAQSPLIQWFHELAGLGSNVADEIPWCSGFMNAMAWLARCTRSKRANARSWLDVGQVVELRDAVVGYDVVVLKRWINGLDNGLSGHVGLYAGHTLDEAHKPLQVFLVGGNQSNQVTLAPFPAKDVIGVRRLA